MKFQYAAPFIIRPRYEERGLLLPRKYIDGQWQPGQKFQFMASDIAGADRGAAALIDRTTGTNIGTMTATGGLAAMFDGNTNQSEAVCAVSAGTTIGSGYGGKTFAVPTAIESMTVFGSNDDGYINNIDGQALSIEMYGKSGSAPASPTDGTLLGTTGSFNDLVNESVGRQINSSDTATYWNHGWVRFVQTDTRGVRCAELQITGWIV